MNFEDKPFGKEFFVGMFVASGIALLIFFVFSIQGLSGQFSAQKQISVTFNYLGGLKTGQPVLYAGYKVGTVQSISIEEGPPGHVVTRLSVPADLPVHDNSQIMIASSGLIGDKVIEILPASEPGQLVKDGATLEGTDPINMARVLGEVRGLVGDGQRTGIRATLENAERMTENLAEMSQSLKSLADNNEDEINELLANLSKGSRNLPKVIDRADSAARSLNKLANNLSRLSGDNEPAINRMIENLETTSDNLTVFSEDIKDNPSELFWGK